MNEQKELFIDDHTSYVLSLIPFKLNPRYDQDRKKWGEIWDKEHKEDK